MEKNYILKIWYNLNTGKHYRTNTGCKALELSGNAQYIRVYHFGSFAVKNTQKDLRDVIKNFFKTTPKKFIDSYQLCKLDFFGCPVNA